MEKFNYLKINSIFIVRNAHFLQTQFCIQGSFPARTPGNGIPKVTLTVGMAFSGTQLNQADQL